MSETDGILLRSDYNLSHTPHIVEFLLDALYILAGEVVMVGEMLHLLGEGILPEESDKIAGMCDSGQQEDSVILRERRQTRRIWILVGEDRTQFFIGIAGEIEFLKFHQIQIFRH